MNSRERTAYLERRAAQSAGARGGVKASVPALHKGVYAPVSERVQAAPKTEPYRDSVLREMSQGQSCLLLVPGVCNHRLDTTVGCHSNLGIHGKAGARKADDVYLVDGCAACHAWLDTGRAPASQKEQQFMESHLRQVMRWRLRATDPSEPERFRKAARRALERLNATPLTEEDEK